MKHISKATLGFGTLDTDEVWNPQLLSTPCSISKHGYTYYASVNDAVKSTNVVEAIRLETPEKETLKWGCEKLAETVGQAFENTVNWLNKPLDSERTTARINCRDTGTIFLLRFLPHTSNSKRWSFSVKVSVLVTESITPERLTYLAEDVLSVMREYSGDAPQEARHIVFFVHELKAQYPVSRNVLITGDRQSGKTRELIRSALYYARTNPTKRVTLCVSELEISWDKIYDAHRGDYAGDRLDPVESAQVTNVKAVVEALYPNVHFDLYNTRLFTNEVHANKRARGFNSDALFINLLPSDTRFFKVYLDTLRANEIVKTIVVDLDIMTSDGPLPVRKLTAAAMKAGINNCVAFLNKCGLRQIDVVQPKLVIGIGRDHYESVIHRGLGVQTDGNYYHQIIVSNKTPLPTFVNKLRETIKECNEGPSNVHLLMFRLITSDLDHIDYYVNYALQTLVGSDNDLLLKLAAAKTVQERLQLVLTAKIDECVSWNLDIEPDGRGISERNGVVSYTLSPERPDPQKTVDSWDSEIKYLGEHIKSKEICGVEVIIPSPLSNVLLHAIEIVNPNKEQTRDDISRKKVNELLLKHGFDAVVKTVVSRAGDIW